MTSTESRNQHSAQITPEQNDQGISTVVLSAAAAEVTEFLGLHQEVSAATVGVDCLRTALELLGLPTGILDHADGQLLSERRVLLVMTNGSGAPPEAPKASKAIDSAAADHPAHHPGTNNHPHRRPAHIWSERWIN